MKMKINNSPRNVDFMSNEQCIRTTSDASAPWFIWLPPAWTGSIVTKPCVVGWGEGEEKKRRREGEEKQKRVRRAKLFSGTQELVKRKATIQQQHTHT